MAFIWMCIIGLIVGGLAKWIMPGDDPGGCFLTMLLGMAGSIVAGLLGRQLGLYGEGEPAGFLASILGAVLILGIYRVMVGKREKT